MAATRRALVCAALIGVWPAAFAAAQPTPLGTIPGAAPLPRPAPAQRPQQAVPSAPAAAQRPPSVAAAPSPLKLGGGSTVNGMTPAQRALVDRVSAYMSGISNLIGNFVQVGPDGSRQQGDFYISKPGKVRFEYDPPSRVNIIADGSSVVIRDTKLATQDLYPLSQTPLRFLLSERIDLARDTNVVAVYADDIFATVVIEERHPLIGTSKLMLMFGAKDMQLKQWTITDAQGYDTTIAVYNLNTSRRPDPSLFRITYESMVK